MKAFRKAYNLAFIFTLMIIFLYQDFSYALRPPLATSTTAKDLKVFQDNQPSFDSPIYVKPRIVPKPWGRRLFSDEKVGQLTWDMGSEETGLTFATFGDWVAPQFHDSKDELLLVIGTDKEVAGGIPRMIAGFSAQSKTKYGDLVKNEYQSALKVYSEKLLDLIEKLKESGFEPTMQQEGHVVTVAESVKDGDVTGDINKALSELKSARENVDFFYAYIEVSVGDTIVIPRNCLHAVGPGMEILELTLPGKSISLDDMDKYPVRYASFDAPSWIQEQAKGFLEWDRIADIDENILAYKYDPETTSEERSAKTTNLATLVNPKIVGLNKISMDKDSEIKIREVLGPHLFFVLKGDAEVATGGKKYKITRFQPGESLLFIPETTSQYTISATEEDTQIIDLFTLANPDIKNTRIELTRGAQKWINSGLGRRLDAPLDWEAIESFNRKFIANSEQQNAWVSSFWNILYPQLNQIKPRVLQEELSTDTLSERRLSKAPSVIAIAIPNTVAFAAHLDETENGLEVVDSDLMSAGKTFAASQTLVGFGRRVQLVSLVGKGLIGQKFKKFAEEIGFDAFVPIDTEGDTRFAPNIVRDKDAYEWHFSAPGPLFESKEIEMLYAEAERIYSNAASGSVVIMGSKGPVDMWVKLVKQAKSCNLKVFFDSLDKNSPREELRQILSAGVYLIKPNIGEFANLVGKDPKVFTNNPEAIVKEARDLIDYIRKDGGILEIVVVSLAEKGAILITPKEAYFALNPRIVPKNSLGAGDAMVGALAHKISLDRPLDETIKFAAAAATISTQKPGVVRTPLLSEAESLASKIWVTSIEAEKDDETWYKDEIPSNVLEFEDSALDIALQFFDQNTNLQKLRESLLGLKGINDVHWDGATLTIFTTTEVVKIHPREHEINERLGLKDRFYIRERGEGKDDFAIKIYYQDTRDFQKQSGPVYVLGVGRNSHDSGAVLVKDGVIIGAIEEERLVQNKHTRAYFPRESVRYLLKAHGLTWDNISHIAVMYDYNFFRDTPHSKSPYYHFKKTFGVEGLASEESGRYSTERLHAFLQGMGISYDSGYVPPVTFVKHHKSHACSAWYSSGFPEPTLIVVNDGRGEDEATSIWLAVDGKLKKISSSPYVHSLGHFYHIVTKYLGYKSHDEGKIMGFAPYGYPRDKEEEIRVRELRGLMKEAVQFDRNTGQIRMAQRHFNFRTFKDFEKINFSEEFLGVLGKLVHPLPEGTGRSLDPSRLEYRPQANLAYVLQERIEEILREMLEFYLLEHPETQGVKHVVMAGGLSLNVAANGKLIESGVVDADKFFVPAFPADDGAPVGAALSVANEEYNQDTRRLAEKVSLGREYSSEEIKTTLDRFGLVEGEDYIRLDNDEELVKDVADMLADDKTIAWFQGGAELGPRALGNRSILHRLDDPQGNLIVNRIKNREPWRPSALSIQEERAAEFLEGISVSPFMTIGFPVKQNKKDVIKAGAHPADGTTRPQTVSQEANPIYWELLGEMGKRTGVPGVLNTSFNRWGPIVETPEDALNTLYYGEGIDQLAIGQFLVKRTARLKPSVLNARDEAALKEQFNKVRYAVTTAPEDWDLFWEIAEGLVESRNSKHQHFLTLSVAGEEIFKIPLIKEMFQRGPREKIIADLSRQIQKRVPTIGKTELSIETTAGEYKDIVIDLFEQFLVPELKAKYHIVKPAYGREFAVSSVFIDNKDFEYPNPLLSLKDPTVFSFVRDILYDRYARYGLELELVDGILQYSIDNRLDPEKACKKIYESVIDFPSKENSTSFHKVYFGEYKQKVKPELLYGFMKGKIEGPVVLDAGAGMSAIAVSLLDGNPEIERFISTHNIDYRHATVEDPRMEFAIETIEDGFHIDVADNSVHTIIVTGRLHHLYPGKELDLFKEFARILHPEGKILVIEDAWSEQLLDPETDEFSKRFRSLSQEQKVEVSAFLDWIGTRLLPGLVPMPRPWNFKSIEEWDRQLFQPSGFTAVSVEYHGFPDRKFTPLPLSIVELKKLDKLMPSLSDRLIKSSPTNKDL